MITCHCVPSFFVSGKSKKHLLPILLMLVCQAVAAGSVSKQRALQKAKAVFGQSVPLQLAVSGSKERPAYYVFNAQRADKGFVIVAGEETGNGTVGSNDASPDGVIGSNAVLADGIIGFSENGVFDGDNLPPALAYMLQCYEEQVEMVRSGQAEVHRPAAIHGDISPMVRTQWDQDAPYNGQNPVNPISGTIFPATGCVATAMAQVLKYWSSPNPVKAIPAYTYYLSKDGSSASKEPIEDGYTVDVEGLSETVFDYSLMQDTYGSADTGSSADEVARLMAYCGRAVEMKYKNSSSGADVYGTHFATYFGFNPNFRDVWRGHYSSADWDELIYSELSAGRPVIYSGGNYSATKYNGHAFVCDGYANGLFHINWGWSGKYDGYYLLSTANPYGTGIGGGDGKYGYSISQEALLGIQPQTDNPAEGAAMMYVKSITADDSQLTRSGSAEDYKIPVTYSTYNYDDITRTYDFGIGIFKDGELVQEFVAFTNRTLAPRYGRKDEKQTIVWGGGVSSGSYVLKNIYRLSGTTKWKSCLYSNYRYLNLEVSGNTMNISENSQWFYSLRINSVDLEGQHRLRKEITLHANVTNLGTEFTTPLYLFVNGKPMACIGVNIDPDEEEDVTIPFVPSETGATTLQLYCDVENGDTPVGEALWTKTIDVAAMREPDLAVTSLSIADSYQTSGKRYIRGNTFELTSTVKNNDTEDFDDVLYYDIYKVYSVEGTTYYGKRVERKTIPALVGPGSSETFVVAFDHLEDGEMYWVVIRCFLPSTGETNKLADTSIYTISSGSDGIQIVELDNQPATPVYDISGRKAGPGTKGIVIRRGRKHVVY
jgi:hypothetical protein